MKHPPHVTELRPISLWDRSQEGDGVIASPESRHLFGRSRGLRPVRMYLRAPRELSGVVRSAYEDPPALVEQARSSRFGNRSFRTGTFARVTAEPTKLVGLGPRKE